MRVKQWFMALCFVFLLGVTMADAVEVHAEDKPWVCLIDENGTAIEILIEQDSAGEGWSYEAATKTLTLSGFRGREIDIQADELCIFLTPGTVNVLEGEEPTLHSNEARLVITGGGELDLDATDNAALLVKDLELRDGRVTANNEVCCTDTAVISGGSLEVSSERNPVLTVYNELTISGGSVKVVGEENYYAALCTHKNLTVSGGELYVESGDMAIFMTEEGTFRMDGGSVYLKALGDGVWGSQTHVEINDGKLDIASAGHYGMQVSDMVMTGGMVTIGSDWMGLELDNPLVVTGGSMDVHVAWEEGNPIMPANFQVADGAEMKLSGGACYGFVNGVAGGIPADFLAYKDPAYLYDSEDFYYQRLDATYYNKIYTVDWSGMTIEENEKKSREIDTAFVRDWADIGTYEIDGFTMLDITNPYQVDLSGGAEITFPAEGILEGDLIIVLHLKSDGSWESIPAVAGNGVITGTFTSLSPICYGKLVKNDVPSNDAPSNDAPSNDAPSNDAPSNDAPSNDASSNDASSHVTVAATEPEESELRSPKTGESPMTWYVSLLAIAAFGGAVYGIRRGRTHALH